MQFKMTIVTNDIAKMLTKVSDDIVTKASEQALVAGGHVVEAHAKINLQGHGLHKTGQLGNSIQVYDPSPESVLVGSRGVIYAAVHEFGATIRPKRAKVLHWMEGDEHVFAKQVVIPPRPYLRPAIDENKQEVLNAMAAVVGKYL